jgi:hypothetical protein
MRVLERIRLTFPVVLSVIGISESKLALVTPYYSLPIKETVIGKTLNKIHPFSLVFFGQKRLLDFYMAFKIIFV